MDVRRNVVDRWKLRRTHREIDEKARGNDAEDDAGLSGPQPPPESLHETGNDRDDTGTDSRAGTLIHELSHFTVVAGTSDFAYGQSAASRLARTSPSRAVRNADNHEYFAENTPAQKQKTPALVSDMSTKEFHLIYMCQIT